MRNQRGITLIALVITIIVLLILAGVTIAMLSGENGILTRATQTKAENAKATANDQARLAYMTVRTEIAAEKTSNGSYTAAGAHETLAKKCAKDLKNSETLDSTVGTANGWYVKDNSTSIVLTFVDSALTEANHQLVYTINLSSDPVSMNPTSY